MRERLRVPAGSLLGRRPVRACRPLPLCMPTPALRARDVWRQLCNLCGGCAGLAGPFAGAEGLPVGPFRPFSYAICSALCLRFGRASFASDSDPQL